MITLQNANYEIIIQNDDTYTPKSADNKHIYENAHFLDSQRYISNSYSVIVTSAGSAIHSCILLAQGGVSGIHKNSAIVHQDLCLVAVGPYLVALQLPVLDLKWSTAVDTATCFGVYHSTKYQCFISHGELRISQVFYSGEIGWHCSGKDIFTNGFELFDDHIIAIDFNDVCYRIEVETGENKLLY